MRALRWLVKVLLPLVVIAASAAVAVHTVSNRPQAERRARPAAVTAVDVVTASPTDYQVIAHSRGTVRPRTRSTLVAEVAGRIVEVSPRFREGGFFEAGDVLLRIDPRDYAAAAKVAEADLVQARAALREELARAAQAEREWKRLGEPGEPDPLVLRRPQVESARAAVARARARLAMARLDLERTAVVAPYAGRVLEQQADLGQHVSPNTPLARIYAVDYAEVRLPLSGRQLEFVDVPEVYRRDAPGGARDGPPVRLVARTGRRVHTWPARLVRAEGAFDTRSRQLFVIAQVEDPYGRGPDGAPPLKVGQFVEAEVQGYTLEGVFVIPRAAVRAGDRVLVVDGESRLRSREVEVLWGDEESVVVGEGLAPGDRLVVTPLAAGLTGTVVRIASVDGERPAVRGDRRAPARPAPANGAGEPRAAPAGSPERPRERSPS